MLFGAHVSAAEASRRRSTASRRSVATPSRSSRRAPACGSPRRTRPRRSRAFARAARQARVKSVSCHALYLVNLASRDAAVRENSLAALRATMETGRAIGADAVVFHVGSHLGLGFDEAVDVVDACADRTPRADDGRPLALHRERRGDGRDDRPVRRRARDALRRGRPAPAARHLHRLVPLVGLRRRRRRRGGPRRPRSRSSTARSGSSGFASCTSTTRRRRSGRTATATSSSARA